MSEGVAAVTDISCFSLCIDVKSTSWYSLRICASCLTINDKTDLRLTVLYSVPIQTGMTALMAAANKGHASVMTLLLDAKADVNLADCVRHALILKMRGCVSHENLYDVTMIMFCCDVMCIVSTTKSHYVMGLPSNWSDIVSYCNRLVWQLLWWQLLKDMHQSWHRC
jgi:Ankyrin repeat